MKGVMLSICLCLAGLSGTAQEGKIEEFVHQLQKTKAHSDQRLLEKAFTKAHKEFLIHYKAYSQTEDIEKSGNFDCLSGTLFFSKVLDELGIAHKIYETNYHIFLIAQTSKGDVLVETTDRMNGLVKNKAEIEERLRSYRTETASTQNMYLTGLNIFNEVSREQMKGLVYFNRAVSTFLQEDFVRSCAFIKKSKDIYDSPRIGEFSKVLIQQIAVSDLDESLKHDLIGQMKPLVSERISLASR